MRKLIPITFTKRGTARETGAGKSKAQAEQNPSSNRQPQGSRTGEKKVKTRRLGTATTKGDAAKKARNEKVSYGKISNVGH
jgi:hypothetical protein